MIAKPHANFQTMQIICEKFKKDRLKHVRGVANTSHPLYIYTIEAKLTEFIRRKNDMRTVKKANTYRLTMTKRPVKIQKNRCKAVGGDALSWYLLPKHFYSI